MPRRFFTPLFALALLAPFAADAEGIVVAVNPGGDVASPERAEVINIFPGGFRRFPSVRAAVPVDLPRDDPARDRRRVGRNFSEIGAYWARLTFSGRTRPPIQAQSVDEASRLALDSDNGIAYFGRSQASGRLKIVFELPPRGLPE